MRRVILLLTVAALVVAIMAVSAVPASAGLNGTVQCSVHSTLECTDAQLGLGGNIT